MWYPKILYLFESCKNFSKADAYIFGQTNSPCIAILTGIYFTCKHSLHELVASSCVLRISRLTCPLPPHTPDTHYFSPPPAFFELSNAFLKGNNANGVLESMTLLFINYHVTGSVHQISWLLSSQSQRQWSTGKHALMEREKTRILERISQEQWHRKPRSLRTQE